MECCSSPMASAMIRRALRNAVSPLVIGAATTPRRASTPPATPNQEEQTYLTTVGASKYCTKVLPPSAAWAVNCCATSGETTSRQPP